MYLSNEYWKESYNTAWTNWAPAEGDKSECGQGHTDQNHKWTGETCNSNTALCLCEWRGKKHDRDVCDQRRQIYLGPDHIYIYYIYI